MTTEPKPTSSHESDLPIALKRTAQPPDRRDDAQPQGGLTMTIEMTTTLTATPAFGTPARPAVPGFWLAHPHWVREAVAEGRMFAPATVADIAAAHGPEAAAVAAAAAAYWPEARWWRAEGGA